LLSLICDHDKEITAEIAKGLLEKEPKATWHGIDENLREGAIKEINTQLEKRSIRPVTRDVIKWRISKVMIDRKCRGRTSILP